MLSSSHLPKSLNFERKYGKYDVIVEKVCQLSWLLVLIGSHSLSGIPKRDTVQIDGSTE